MTTARTAEEWEAHRAERNARYAANRARLPEGAITWGKRQCLYGRNVHTMTMRPELLATFTDDDLVDLCDGGYGGHFGGHVERDAATGTAVVTVYID